MEPTRMRRFGDVLAAALGLTGLASFVVLAGTPAGILALLALFASATALLAAVGKDEHSDNAPRGDHAPRSSTVPDGARVPVGGRAPPAPISTILNSHPDNRRRRASRAEREAVVWELELHLLDERLDEREFDTRHDSAVKALTRGDLADLLIDLPRPRHRERT